MHLYSSSSGGSSRICKNRYGRKSSTQILIITTVGGSKLQATRGWAVFWCQIANFENFTKETQEVASKERDPSKGGIGVQARFWKDLFLGYKQGSGRTFSWVTLFFCFLTSFFSSHLFVCFVFFLNGHSINFWLSIILFLSIFIYKKI